MTTHSEKNINKFVKEEAEKYATFIGGVCEESWSGFCVHGNGEFVYFDSKYVGTEHYYYPCRWDSIRYAVEARICVGGESVEIIL